MMLVNWTDQAIRSVSETTQRAEQVTQMVEILDGRMATLFSTRDRCDLVGVLAASEFRMIRRRPRSRCGQLREGARIEILWAFNADEMRSMLANPG